MPIRERISNREKLEINNEVAGAVAGALAIVIVRNAVRAVYLLY